MPGEREEGPEPPPLLERGGGGGGAVLLLLTLIPDIGRLMCSEEVIGCNGSGGND